ncbi:MAG: peroxide stress protein YaaA [Paludibacter sp.]
MLILLSPAKIMNFKPENLILDFTIPEFLKDAGQLIELLRDLNKDELSRLLEINSNLTDLNFDRIFNWHRPFTLKNAKQAVFVFDGEVYRGLNARTFSTNDFEYAQNHLRLLSGLYGILRPLDLIQPYRLEVSSKLRNYNGNDLYDFWQEKVTHSALKALKISGKPEVILNLASGEYIKTLLSKSNNLRIIDIEFYEYKNDNLKQIVIYTKKARGLMARFVIQNKIEDVEDLKGFSGGGYWYSPQLSSENKLVFTR